MGILQIQDNGQLDFHIVEEKWLTKINSLEEAIESNIIEITKFTNRLTSNTTINIQVVQVF